VRAQIEQADRHFALIDTSLEVVAADAVPASELEIDTRDERDALGHDRFTRGVVHVFVVGRLADVDIAGQEIRGVHWRERADRTHRWVILSKIAGSLVLSHELGHFFGLPHSTYDISLMNKTVRLTPIVTELTFAEPEVEACASTATACSRQKMLRRATGSPRPDHAAERPQNEPRSDSPTNVGLSTGTSACLRAAALRLSPIASNTAPVTTSSPPTTPPEIASAFMVLPFSRLEHSPIGLSMQSIGLALKSFSSFCPRTPPTAPIDHEPDAEPERHTAADRQPLPARTIARTGSTGPRPAAVLTRPLGHGRRLVSASFNR
jgi:hypothetical protein